MTAILRPSKINLALTNAFIDEVLQEDTRPFANGDTGVNNHLNGGYDEVPEPIRDTVTDAVSSFIIESNCDLDFIAPVPSGADGWGYAVVRALKRTAIPVLQFEKEPGERRVFKATELTSHKIEYLKEQKSKPRGLVIDDVTSDGGTNEAMADHVTSYGLEVSLVLSLFFRGDLAKLKSSYPRAVLMAQRVPNEIDWAERARTGLIVPADA